MKNLPTIYQSKTKEELLKQVLDVHQAIAEFYRSIPEGYFESNAIPDGWSVRRNMKHVIGTNKAFGFFIGLPTFLLKILGKPKAKQPTVDQIDPTNRHGITNYGRYEKTNSANSLKKEKLLRSIQSSAIYINKQIGKRTEEELDTLSGLFGGMSIRTFIHFLLKHNVHHTNVVKLRMEESI